MKIEQKFTIEYNNSELDFTPNKEERILKY